MSVNKEIDVYLPGQDLREEAAFTAPVNWCRIKRLADKGKFIKHSRAFRLTDPKLRPRKLQIGKRVFDPSSIFSGDRRIGRVEMYANEG